MALKVWLPLNGNINNQGLSDYKFTNTGATINDTGKIGKCYSFDGTDDRIYTTGFNLGNTFTIGAWIKPVNFSGNQWIICLNSNGETADTQAGFYTNSSGITYVAGGSNSTYSISLTANTWYHVMLSSDGTNTYLYLNGTQVATRTAGTLTKTNLTIGARSANVTGAGTAIYGPFNGLMNDVRIYDECLSAKEIKEISKGLVVHYKLSGPGVNPNLLTNMYGVVLTSNGAVSESTNPNAFTLDSSVTAANYAGKDVTISVDIEAIDVIANTTSGKHRAGVEIAFARTGGGTSYIGAWLEFTTTAITKKTRLVTTATIPSDWNGSTSEKKMYIQRIKSGSIKLSNVKLEIGDCATSYIPHENESGYTALGYDKAITNDCSGNGYNLTSIDTSLTIQPNSARYLTYAYRSTASKQLGKIPEIFSSGQLVNELTLSGWWKSDTADNNTKNLFSIGGNSFIRFGMSTTTKLWVYTLYEGNSHKTLELTVSSSMADNKWHHYVITFKNGVLKAYIDGTLIGTTDYSGTATNLLCSNTNNYIGSYSGSAENVPGGFSDFRIYATALSDEEILTMYKNSGIIDNKGNMYCYEFIEEDN